MHNLDLIKDRRSVRTFDSLKKIDSNTLYKIEEYIKNVTNPFNSSVSFKLFNAKDYNLTSNVTSGEEYYIIGTVNKEENYEIAFGYTLENIVIYLQSLGLSSVIMAGTIDRNLFEPLVNASKIKIMPAVLAIGFESKEMTKTERVLRRFLHADEKRDLSNLLIEEYNPIDKYMSDVLDGIRYSASAKNLKPVLVSASKDKIDFYLNHTKGYINSLGDVQKIDLGIALSNAILVLNDYNKGFKFEKFNISDFNSQTSYEITLLID